LTTGLLAVLLNTGSGAAHCAPAVALVISDCAPAPPPLIACSEIVRDYLLGQPITFYLSAVDSSGLRATGYSGTVAFSSSDGSALLPATHTFTPNDNSVHLATATFNSPGSLPGWLSGTSLQSVTAIDSANQFTTTASFSIRGAPGSRVTPIPTLSQSCLFALSIGLFVAGVGAPFLRRYQARMGGGVHAHGVTRVAPRSIRWRGPTLASRPGFHGSLHESR
jgi:hypothetical protein